MLIPVLVVLVASWVTAWFLLSQRESVRNDLELKGEVAELRLLAERGVDPATGAPFSTPAALLEQYIQRSIPDPYETMFVIVDGTVTYRSADNPPVRLDVQPELLDQVRDVTTVTMGDLETDEGHVRWIAAPVSANGQRGVFVDAIFEDLANQELSVVLARLTAFGLGALLLAAGIAWVVSGRLLAPLRQMRRTAKQINEQDLSGRIPVDTDSGDEVADLARTFNEMLDRLSEAFASQKEFIDDAGHELRTPLTIVQGHLELLEDDPEQRQQSIAVILDELSRMSRIVHDLQTLTKASQPGFVEIRPVDLTVLLDDIVVKASALGDRVWRIEQPEEITVALDRQRVTQAMLQLASNAVRQTTPADTISIAARVSEREVELLVADSGPGIPESERDIVTHRFARGSGCADEGAGLGLAVVSAIAQAHGGGVQIGDSPFGGAEVALILPLRRLSPQPKVPS